MGRGRGYEGGKRGYEGLGEQQGGEGVGVWAARPGFLLGDLIILAQGRSPFPPTTTTPALKFPGDSTRYNSPTAQI